ncbi:MAG TPA: NAD(P)H-dependent oxidoreductase subunit E, partial [Actinomycetota bacterium]
MELHLMAATPTGEERTAVDELLGTPDTAWEGGTRTAGDLRVSRAQEDRRTLLLPALHALQGRVGWISEGGLNYVCERLDVPPAEAYGVASFYAMFSVEERPTTVVHVCDDLACRVDRSFADGGSGYVESVRGSLGHEDAVTVVSSPCLGRCERGRAVFLQRSGSDR